MNESEDRNWRETSWRRPLNAAEEARLQRDLTGHPEAQADWEAEQNLSQLLAQLPDAPVASNFTARVLQAAERDGTARPATVRLREWLQRQGHRAVPRLAWATTLALALGWLGYQQFQAATQAQMAEALVLATDANALKEPEIFKDFEAIQRLGQMPSPADEELWLALYQNP